MSCDPNRAQELFLRLVPLSPADRLGLLERECGDDLALRNRVAALLKAHDAPDSYLDRPDDACLATMDSHAEAAESPATTPEHPANLRGPWPSGDDARHAAPGVVVGGRYALQEKIGEGGMGDVWVAKQTTPVKRKVALKLIKPGLDSRAVLQRFEQERQALALMDHPNIARVLDGGMTSTSQPYFVMELVNGLSLNKFCDASKLTLRERLELFVPICQAVQHAHQKGIVHRDLKPANILVTMIDGKPVPKVIDFGVAKATSGKLTEETMSTGFGAVVGTLEYMSPEQAGFSGSDIDTRADIYSLGVILYELLTGLRPIDAERLRQAALTEMIRFIREEDPSKPSTRLSTHESLPSLAALRQTEPKKLMALLRGELDWVVMKCPEKQRDRHYDTANALVRDIQRYLADEVVEARPPSAVYRFQKFIRRNKGQAIAASAVLGVLLVGIIGTTWGLFEARRQAQFARSETDEKGRALLAEAERVKERDAANDELNHRLGVSEMILAKAAFDNRDVKLAIERIEKVPVKQRGWEWRYLKQQASGGIFTLAGHKIGGMWVAFSPDGTLIATGSNDQNAPIEVKLWDAQTGAFLLELKGLPKDSGGAGMLAMSLAFSPDSARIVVSGGDDKARVFHAKTGVLDFELSVSGEIGCAAFSPDGTRIITGFQSQDGGVLQIWEVQTRQPVLDWKAHKFHITRVMFSPDGTKIISGSHDHRVKVWDAATGNIVLDAKGVLGNESGLAVSPDGKRLLVGRDDGSRVIDALTGEVKLVLKQRPRVVQLVTGIGEIPAVAFSPDGTRMVTCGGYGTSDATVWDARTGAPLLELHGHKYPVTSAAFSPDGMRIITGSSDGTAKVWDVRTGTRRLELESFKPELQCAAISPGGLQIVTGQGEYYKPGVATIWDARTGVPQFTLDGFRGMIRCVAVSADGTRIITGGGVGNRNGGIAPPMTGEAKVWDARTGKLLFELKGLQEDVTGADFSRDGARIATGGGDAMDGQGNEVKIWDARTGALLHDLTRPAPMLGFAVGSRVSVAFSPDGTRLAVAGARSMSSMGEGVNVWDTKTGKLKAEMKTSGKSAALCVAFSPDGQRVATGSYIGSTANIWDANTGEPLLELKGHTGNILGVAYSPDSGPQERIVTISTDKTTRVWDARTGTTLLELRGHSGMVSNVAFTADGSRLLTACRASHRDPTPAKVITWDVRELNADDVALREPPTESNVRRHRQEYLEARAAKDDFAAAFHLKRVPQEQHKELLVQADEEFLAKLLERAELCMSKGNGDEALVLYIEVANLQKDKLGPDASETLSTLEQIAELHLALEQFDLGIQVSESVLKGREAKLGRRHPETLHTLANLAMQYQRAGRPKEAIPLLEECYPTIEWVGDALLEAYAKSGESVKLTSLIEQQVNNTRKMFPSDSMELAIKLGQCGGCQLQAKAFAEAEKLLRECLEIRGTKPEAEIGPSFEVQGRLGAALLGQQKYADAEPLLLQVYEGLNKQLTDQNRAYATPQLLAACDHLVQLYTATEKPEKVKKWRAEREKYAPVRAPDGGER